MDKYLNIEGENLCYKVNHVNNLTKIVKLLT